MPAVTPAEVISAPLRMDAVRLDPRGGKAGRQLIGEFPMRGDGMTVQQPVAEREGAGADRSMHACGGPAAAQGGVVRGGPPAASTTS